MNTKKALILTSTLFLALLSLSCAAMTGYYAQPGMRNEARIEQLKNLITQNKEEIKELQKGKPFRRAASPEARRKIKDLKDANKDYQKELKELEKELKE